jgi:hypothetical protein
MSIGHDVFVLEKAYTTFGLRYANYEGYEFSARGHTFFARFADKQKYDCTLNA